MYSPIAPAFKGVSEPMVEHCRENGDAVDTLKILPMRTMLTKYSDRMPKFVRRMRRKQRYPKD